MPKRETVLKAMKMTGGGCHDLNVGQVRSKFGSLFCYTVIRSHSHLLPFIHQITDDGEMTMSLLHALAQDCLKRDKSRRAPSPSSASASSSSSSTASTSSAYLDALAKQASAQQDEVGEKVINANNIAYWYGKWKVSPSKSHRVVDLVAFCAPHTAVSYLFCVHFLLNEGVESVRHWQHDAGGGGQGDGPHGGGGRDLVYQGGAEAFTRVHVQRRTHAHLASGGRPCALAGTP